MIRGLAGVMVWSAAGSAASYDGGAGGGSAGPDSSWTTRQRCGIPPPPVSYGNQLAGGFFSAVMIGGGKAWLARLGTSSWAPVVRLVTWFVCTRFVFWRARMYLSTYFWC